MVATVRAAKADGASGPMVDRSDEAGIQDSALHGRTLATGPEPEHDVGERHRADRFIEWEAPDENAFAGRRGDR